MKFFPRYIPRSHSKPPATYHEVVTIYRGQNLHIHNEKGHIIKFPKKNIALLFHVCSSQMEWSKSNNTALETKFWSNYTNNLPNLQTRQWKNAAAIYAVRHHRRIDSLILASLSKLIQPQLLHKLNNINKKRGT